jgi:hypothetical protein
MNRVIVIVLFLALSLCFGILLLSALNDLRKEKAAHRVTVIEKNYKISEQRNEVSSLLVELGRDDLEYFRLLEAYAMDKPEVKLRMTINRVNRRSKLFKDLDLDEAYIKELEEIVYAAQAAIVEDKLEGQRHLY